MADPTEQAELAPAAARAVKRALASRETAYQDEVQRLLDAGLALLVESNGSVAPRVADIVTRAGLSNQAFYRHFAGKDELIAAIVDAGTHRLDSYLRHRVASAGDPEAQLRAWITGVLSQAAKPTVAAPTRAAMSSFRGLPSEARQGVSVPHGSPLLLEILGRVGSQDPGRDAAMLTITVFGRLEDFLWRVEPSAADLNHAVEFCMAAVRR
jgi:AcrR family transcriptional regulator